MRTVVECVFEWQVGFEMREYKRRAEWAEMRNACWWAGCYGETWGTAGPESRPRSLDLLSG